MREEKMRQRGLARPKTQSKKSTQDDVQQQKKRPAGKQKQTREEEGSRKENSRKGKVKEKRGREGYTQAIYRTACLDQTEY